MGERSSCRFLLVPVLSRAGPSRRTLKTGTSPGQLCRVEAAVPIARIADATAMPPLFLFLDLADALPSSSRTKPVNLPSPTLPAPATTPWQRNILSHQCRTPRRCNRKVALLAATNCRGAVVPHIS